MGFTRYASFDVTDILDIKGTPTRQRTASLDKVADYENYRTSDGFMYVRLRAISSRTNKNSDGWPTLELAGSPEILSHHQSSTGFTVEAADGNKEFGFATFVGKPVFVDHNNTDPKKTRGVIADSKFRILDPKEAKLDPYWSSNDVDPEHLPASEVELLLEIDAKAFPKLAADILNGDLDGFSMGADVERSKCSHCGHVATNPDEYCSHILMKGAHHDYKTADGKRVARKSYENCYGVKFFEISAVFDPADETARARHVQATTKVGELFDQGMTQDPLRGDQDFDIERLVMDYMAKGIDENTAREMATNKIQSERTTPGVGEGETWAPKMKDYAPSDASGMPVARDPRGNALMGLQGFPPPVRLNQPSEGFPAAAEEALNEQWPQRPVQNDPRWSSVHTAENDLPQSFKVHAPDEVDTLRDEHLCPICGNDMEGETCDVCFAPGTLVRTAKGYRPIESIKSGDIVLSAEGQFRRVHDVMERDYQGVLKELDAPSLMQPILTTDNHPFSVLVGQSQHQCKPGSCDKGDSFTDRHSLRWIHAGCLSDQHFVATNVPQMTVDYDYIDVPATYTAKRKHGQLRRGPQRFDLTDDFLWAVGLYLAEGSAGDRSITYSSHRNEHGFRARIRAIFGDYGYTTRVEFRDDKPNSAWVHINSSVLSEWWPDWLGHGCAEKQIPAVLLNLPLPKLTHLYQGYLDGDGSIAGNSAKTTSPVLALQIAEIAQRLGHRASIQHESPIGKRVAYTINNVSDQKRAYHKPTTERRSKSVRNTWDWDDHVLYRLTSVKDVPYTGKVYNLVMEGHPTYTVQNLLVHNCGFVEEPKPFQNPDLSQAEKIREEMKQQEAQQAQPGGGQGPPDPAQGPDQSRQAPPQGQQAPATKPQPTASVTNEMHWTPLVPAKTAARINQVERPVAAPNTITTNEPKNAVVTQDQLTPVTSAMLTAKRLIANAQRNHTGESMNTQRLADGATPPDGTSAKERVDVTGIGGVDQASNEAASAAQSQVDVNGIGGTGVEGVEPDSTESLPTASQTSNDSGFNTDKTTEDSGLTSTFGDSDGSASGVGTPVTPEPFPASEDGVKASFQRRTYEDGTLEGLDQQGDPVAQGGTAVKGVQPISESFGDRVNLLEHKTSPSNNSGPTDTWSGTDGNGVLKQQDPVTQDSQEWGGVKVPDVQLHTTGAWKAHFLSAIRLAEAEQELGLITREEKPDRIAQLDAQTPAEVQAQINTLSRVKTAGLAKLAMQRQSGVRRLPAAFGKATAAPNGFERIASDTPVQQEPVSDDLLDSAFFLR